ALVEKGALSFEMAEVLKMCVKAKMNIIISGGTGAGKTTLLNTLLGILPPTEGDVLVGGVSLKSAGVDALRKVVGTVLQDDSLFAGSIAENISFFDPHADLEWVAKCAAMAAMGPEIAAMPMGFNTLVGDMGTVLSGGQKQRLLLARALYKKPSILFLDEATSHLDIAREKQVNEVVKSLNITRVIVAHRPETIASADRVIVLHGGKIVQEIRNPGQAMADAKAQAEAQAAEQAKAAQAATPESTPVPSEAPSAA
ncbi:MAG: Flp pilus assembly complex ATPase component TadA, partial [Burkholderiales bacterium]|nr:Flp pilus assembly complex ATPase component TadA [Burkholderiales bacterium]